MDYNIALLDEEGFSFTAPERFRNRSRKHVYWCTDTFICVPKEYDELFPVKELDTMMGLISTIRLKGFSQTWYDCKPYVPDHFAPTPGNVLHIVRLLLSWAETYPEGIWRVTEAL